MNVVWLQSWLFFSAAVEAVFALLISRRLRTAAGPLFVLNYLIAGYWCLLFALDLGTADLSQKLLYQHLRYLLVPFSGVVFLEACHQHATGRPLLVGWRLAIALAIPLATLVLSLSGPGFTIHPLVRYDFRVVAGELGPMLAFERGPLGYAAFYYEHALVALTIFVLLRSRLETQWERSSRWTLAVVMLSGNISWVFYYLGWTGAWGPMLSPALFPFFRGIMAWAVLRGRVIDLAPVARASLIELLPDMLLIVDRDELILDANRSARETLHLERNAVYRKPLESVLHGWPELLASWRAGKPRTEIARDDVHYAITILPVQGADAEVARIIQIKDVTHRKVRERELERARESAEAAHEALRNFIAVTGHEIRNPMNGVVGFAHLLRDSALDVHQREYVDNISRYGESIVVVLDDLLDYSKISAARMELLEAEFDLAELCHGICRMLAPLARRKGTSLHMEMAPDLPATLHGDSVRIGQIVTNLVSNAVKFTSDGEVTIRIAASAVENGRFRVTIAVSDTGVGIEESALRNLFRPYVQASPSVQRTHGGTGLGLSIVKGLCELMQGGIEVRSTPGKGSTFTASILLAGTDAVRSAGAHE